MQNKNIILRLTYLWAFIEASLGGLLHFFHLPITGLVIGGFAIISIVLIAKYAQNVFVTILQALGIVLAIKFALSPQSPAGAYIAVAFQGCSAAIIFSLMKVNKITIYLFSVVVMLESAIQKPLMSWIILGKEYWSSVIKLGEDFFKLSSSSFTDVALLTFAIYLLMYVVWAIIIANWAIYIKNNIEFSTIDTTKVKEIMANSSNSPRKYHRKSKLFRNCIFFALITLAIASLRYFGLINLDLIIRLAVVIFILYFVIPFAIKVNYRFLKSNNNKKIDRALKEIPSIRLKTQVAYEMSKPVNSLKKLKLLVFTTFLLNLFYDE